LERSDNPGFAPQNPISTLKGFRFWQTLSGFNEIIISKPRVVAALQRLGWD